MAITIFAVLLAFLQLNPVTAVQCMSKDNQGIDWFIMYKLPGNSRLPVNTKNMFYYMDVNSPSWSLSETTLDNRDQAVYYTLNQIYSSKKSVNTSADLMYLMYNDEDSSQTLKWETLHGHTKGVIGFDSKTGFWLIHSTPKFPPERSQGYSWPSSADTYGQSFLCISMDTQRNLDEIGQQLLYNYPQIYDSQTSDILSDYPNMYAAMNGKHVTSAPWQRETTLTSLAGTSFLSFAKFSKFENDLYAEWLAPRFGATLLVETWQNGEGKMCSNCTGVYKVFNVETVDFSGGIEFKETQDHSKWAVTDTSSNVWTCIGDINRQVPQMHRPGGTVCFQDMSVWQSFHAIIKSFHDCKPYSDCIMPGVNLQYKHVAKP